MAWLQWQKYRRRGMVYINIYLRCMRLKQNAKVSAAAVFYLNQQVIGKAFVVIYYQH